MTVNAIEAFKSAISVPATRVSNLPPIVLVFGGPLGDAQNSARQMFLNWTLAKGHTINSLLRTPEQFNDWNEFEGYSNLIDFERDAGNLTQAIVLFSESEGSFAELGAFCMDNVLSERLFVVIARQHYNAGSFIAKGPIKKIELLHGLPVCVVETLMPNAITDQLPEIAIALEEKVKTGPRTQAFEPMRDRDQFLMVADLIELFGAVTLGEVHDLLTWAGINIQRNRLEQIVKQLLRFELIHAVQRTTRRFFVPPSDRRSYLSYQSPAETPPFDRARFKMTKVDLWLNADVPRSRAYYEVHPK
ncbi:MAG: hypothetical protein E6R11_05710 [Rhodocyclaceae bacterium]|nr:MAG: hypothetical protein E6R11_05710 [Rhodocyclaceae bacterium]